MEARALVAKALRVKCKLQKVIRRLGCGAPKKTQHDAACGLAANAHIKKDVRGDLGALLGGYRRGSTRGQRREEQADT